MPNERDNADLAEIQTITFLEDRIDGGDERLQNIVDEVRYADSRENAGREGANLSWAGAGAIPLMLAIRSIVADLLSGTADSDRGRGRLAAWCVHN